MCCVFIGTSLLRDNVPQFCFSRTQDLGTFLDLVKHSGKTANSGKLVFSPVVHRISPLDLEDLILIFHHLIH